MLEWCPYDFNINLNKNKKTDLKHELSDLTKSIADSLEHSDSSTLLSKNETDKTTSNISSSHNTLYENDTKESFICIDQNGLMYSFSVESNYIKDAAIPLPEDGLVNNVTCISMKKDYVVFGDMDGNVIRWNYVNKLTKLVALRRGNEIKKLKFAPGKENFLLLVQYSDSIEILEASTLETISSHKLQNTKLKFVDSYWTSSDTVLIQFSDGNLKILDFNLKQIQCRNSNSIPSMFVDRSAHKKSILLAFKSILYEMCFNNAKFTQENLLNYSRKSYFNLFLCKIHLNYITFLLFFQLESYFKDQTPIQTSLSNLIRNLSKQMNNLLTDLENLDHKLKKFAKLSAYFNINSFETKFWSLLSLQFQNKSANSDLFDFVVKQNSYFANRTEFLLNEYESLKLFKDKHDFKDKLGHVVKDLLVFNELDLAFNLLLETDPSNENYSQNLTK